MLLTWGIMPDSDSNSSQSFELRTKDGTKKKANAASKKAKTVKKKIGASECCYEGSNASSNLKIGIQISDRETTVSHDKTLR